MQKLPFHRAGEQVEVRGEPWVVLRAEPFDACTRVTLRGTGEGNLGRTTELVAPFDRLKTTPQSSRARRVSRRRALGVAAAAVARAHGWSEPWTAAAAQIDLLPWQLEPALAAVNGAMRLLLADAVGLGKTIQAGLILAELRARGLAPRALVLTPASLRDQWASELRDRFALEPVVFDHSMLARLAAELPPDVNPWSTAELAISSIDLVKRGDVRRALDAIPLDVLVVDEAHHLTPGTDRGALVEDLAARVPWVVFATATPHSGDSQAFAFLNRLGACDGTPPVTFRRAATVAGRDHGRRLVFRGVRPTAAERVLLEETMAYGRAVWSEHRALVAAVICRRAASSAAALERTLTRRRALLATDDAPPEMQAELPWLENDERDALESDALLLQAALADRAREIAWLDRLILLSRAAQERASKPAVIAQLLARTNETAIVFSEYRDTLTFLEERLGDRAALSVIHGGLSARERREAVQQFVSGHARVLLATDAAGEGLNLQARCRLVVNVELPWNPLRLEQRIGRVDRLGQSRRVHAVQLVHRDYFEDRVLARFVQRLDHARLQLHGAQVGEHEVAAAVFAGTADFLPSGEASPSGGEARSAPGAPTTCVRDTAALRRRATKMAASTLPAQPLFARASRRGRQERRVIALFELDCHDDSGRLVARHVTPLVIDLAVADLNRARSTIALAIEHSAVLGRHLTTAADVYRSRVSEELVRTSHAIVERLEHILTRLDSDRDEPLQTSLFDKRAEQLARASAAAAARLQQHARHRLASARKLGIVHGSLNRLIAFWPAVGV